MKEASQMAEFEHLEETVAGLYDRGVGLNYDRQVISIGQWITLKSGSKTPYFINLRPALSFDTTSSVPVEQQVQHTGLLLDAFGVIIDEVQTQRPFDHIFGFPEAGTPLASAISGRKGISLLWKRIENKSGRGIHEMLEGAYHAGQVLLKVDDVVTTGLTKEEDDEFFNDLGLSCEDIVVGVDREQGGRQNVEDKGRHLHSVTTVSRIFEILRTAGRLTQTQYDYLMEYPSMPKMSQEPVDHPWKKNS